MRARDAVGIGSVDSVPIRIQTCVSVYSKIFSTHFNRPIFILDMCSALHPINISV